MAASEKIKSILELFSKMIIFKSLNNHINIIKLPKDIILEKHGKFKNY